MGVVLTASCVPRGAAPIGGLAPSPVATGVPSTGASASAPVATPLPSPSAVSSPALTVLAWGKGEVAAGDGTNGNWKNNPHNAVETSLQDMAALLPQRDASAVFIEEGYDRITQLSRPLNPTLELEKPYRILTQLSEVESPTGLVEVADGYYIASRNRNAILYLDKKTLMLTVVAGRDVAGYSGDGGQGVSASLYSPVGLARSSDGSLYWAEENNHVIRRLAPTGIISTVVGNGTAREDTVGKTGLIADVRLLSPIDVVVGPDDSLYFLQADDHAVYRLADGAVNLAVGTGVKGFLDGKANVSSFNNPKKLEFGPDGLLYIADSGNDRIRRLNPDGAVVTVAGNARQDEYFEDRSPLATDIRTPNTVAFDPDGGMWIYAVGTRHLFYFAASK